MHNIAKDDSPIDSTYYTDQDVAALFGISVGRLRNKLCAGNPLPPHIEPPGSRHRLWPRDAVHAWLEQFVVTVDASATDNRRHRGRPAKKQERSRRR